MSTLASLFRTFGSISALGVLGIVGSNETFAQVRELHSVVCQGCTTADQLAWKANEVAYSIGGGNKLIMVFGNDEPITAFFTVENGEYIPYTCEAEGFCFGGYYLLVAVPYRPLSGIYADDNRIFSRKLPVVQVPQSVVSSTTSPGAQDLLAQYLMNRFNVTQDGLWGVIQGRFNALDTITGQVHVIKVGDKIMVKTADGKTVQLEWMGVMGSIAGWRIVEGTYRDANGNLIGEASSGGGGSFGEVQVIENGTYIVGVANNTLFTCEKYEVTVAVSNADGSSSSTTWRGCAGG